MSTEQINPEPAAVGAPDRLKRCFICLVDQDETDPPSSWVDPCPCTLEAHQDCMLSWVTDCERSKKPLQCPICKSAISIEQPWDPLVALDGTVRRRFTSWSPYALLAGTMGGVYVCMETYGVMAMAAFSGSEAAIQYAFAMPINATPVQRFQRGAIHQTVLGYIAPALIAAKLLPETSNHAFLPMASLYGMYHYMRDERFYSWPPSPELVMTLFPFARAAYYSIWREFVFPYEMKLNRKLLGLPENESPQDPNGAGNGRLNQDGRFGGGVFNFVNAIADALGQGEEGEDGNHRPLNAQLEIIPQDIEVEIGENGEDEVIVNVELAYGEVVETEEGEDMVDEGLANNDDNHDQVEEREADRGEDRVENDENAANPVEEPNHSVPAAPPVRADLGTLGSKASDAIVSALILPGLCHIMGEVMRSSILPVSWTSPLDAWYRYPRRPGLFQYQWGRSLVGGCIFVVIRDLVRVYSKHRRAANMDHRRVKNVDRGRRKSE